VSRGEGQPKSLSGSWLGWQLPAGVALQLFRVQGGARSAIGYVFFSIFIEPLSAGMDAAFVGSCKAFCHPCRIHSFSDSQIDI